MAQIIWAGHFLSGQVLYVPTTTIYQDNKRIILLAENYKPKAVKEQNTWTCTIFCHRQNSKRRGKVAFCPTPDIQGGLLPSRWKEHCTHK